MTNDLFCSCRLSQGRPPAASPGQGVRKPPPHSPCGGRPGLHSMLSQSTLSLTTVPSGSSSSAGSSSGAGSHNKEFKTIRVSKDARGDLGVVIERRDPGPASYIVSGIETGSAVYL